MRKYYRFALALVSISFLTGCVFLPDEQEYCVSPVISQEEEVEVEQVMVVKGDIKEEKEINVTYESKASSALKFGISGEPYSNVYVKKGDTVKKGQLLAQLDVQEYLDQIDECNGNINNTTIEINHNKELQGIDPVNSANYQKNIDLLNKDLTVYNQRKEELSVKKNERQIYADIDGVVISVYPYVAGDLSSEDEIFISLVSEESNLVAETSDVADLEIGMELTAKILNEDYAIVLSSIEDIEGDSTTEETTEDTKKDTDTEDTTEDTKKETDTEENSEESTKVSTDNTKRLVFDFVSDNYDVKDKAYGVARYVTKEIKDVIYIPTTCITTRDGKNYVYMNNEEGFRIEKEIGVGETLGDYTVVTKGLKENDFIIAN